MRFMKYNLNIPRMFTYACKKCGELNYLTSETLGNLTDFSYECVTRLIGLHSKTGILKNQE